MDVPTDGLDVTSRAHQSDSERPARASIVVVCLQETRGSPRTRGHSTPGHQSDVAKGVLLIRGAGTQ